MHWQNQCTIWNIIVITNKLNNMWVFSDQSRFSIPKKAPHHWSLRVSVTFPRTNKTHTSHCQTHIVFPIPATFLNKCLHLPTYFSLSLSLHIYKIPKSAIQYIWSLNIFWNLEYWRWVLISNPYQRQLQGL